MAYNNSIMMLYRPRGLPFFRIFSVCQGQLIELIIGHTFVFKIKSIPLITIRAYFIGAYFIEFMVRVEVPR